MDAHSDQQIQKLIEGQLDSASIERLERLLRSSPEAAEHYLRMLQVHLDLCEITAPVRAFSSDELHAIGAVDGKIDAHVGPDADSDAEATDRRSPLKSHLGGHARHLRSTLLAWGVAAASLAAMLCLALWPNENLPTASSPIAVPVVDTGDEVAEVVRKVDCDWENDRWGVSTSPTITAGQQINLSRGLLVLKFRSGPEVTLSGRTTFVATSDHSAQLLEGTLSAVVPPEGVGFRVITHAGDFVDLGTEFGMIITKEGDVETHVFEGQVRAEPTPSGAERGEQVLLNKGDAWARRESGERASQGSQPDRFMRPIVRRGMAEPGLPVSEGLALRFDAAQETQRDNVNRVYAWGNLASMNADKAIDAWQVEASMRPVWHPAALNSHPAMHFDGNQGLTTEPLALGASQTSVVVFDLEPQAAFRSVNKRDEFQHLGVQLLNLNGFPHTVLQVNQNATLEARVHLGFLKNQPDPVDVGVIRTLRPLKRGPHTAIYTYDSDRSRATLWLDGELVAESDDAPQVPVTTAPRFIGAHPERAGFGFTGYIAEVAIYDRPLSDEETLQVSNWLGAKYQSPPQKVTSDRTPAVK